MATKLKVNYEFVGDSTTPVTRTESIKHGDSMLNTVINAVTATVNIKADKTYVDTELAKKANVNDMEQALGNKADVSELEAVSDRVSTNTTNIATQTARIDNIANLPEGSTTGDAELIDIRVGADGKTYTSAGNAVRGQVSDVKSDLSYLNDVNYNRSVISLNPSLHGYYTEKDVVTGTNFYHQEYVVPRNAISISFKAKSSTAHLKAFFLLDENRNLVKSVEITNPLGEKTESLSGIKYIQANYFGEYYQDDMKITLIDELSEISGVKSEVSQARVDETGTTHSTLKERIDSSMTDIVNDLSQLNEDLTQITEVSNNLFDIDAAHIGYYFRDGAYQANNSYNSSEKINVEIGKTYYFSNDGESVIARFVCFYSLAGNYLTGSDMQNVNSITIFNNVGSVVVSYSASFTKFQVESDEITDYKPYGCIEVKDLEKIRNELTVYNHPIVTENYPTSLRCGYKVFYNANNISNFSAFYIVRGESIYQEKITIGATALRYACGSEEISVNHGLTWYNSVNVIIHAIDLAHTKITLITNGGIFENIFDRPKGYGNNGTWHLLNETMGGSVKQQIEKPNDIWIIGDSYMSYDDSRVGGALYELNEKSPTILSIPGANTVTMAGEFAKMINCYNVAPKTLCLCSGMNDTLETYTQGFNKIKQICKKYGIELILTVIPTTPDRISNNIAVKNYVLSQNNRKIRFDLYVNSNNSGEWYSNCLNSDRVHPTQNGARLLANAILNEVGYLVNRG